MPVTVISNIKQQNRSNTIDTPDFFFLLDSSDINFTVQGIQEDSGFDPGTTPDNRYIIRKVNDLHPGFTGTTSDWGDNDILYYVPPVADNPGYYDILLDASNKQKGVIVFNEGDSKFYGFDGTEWLEIGSGSVGATGVQGFQGFQGPAGSGEGSGSQGFQGFQGNIGITGSQGFQGFQGNIGITGVQGFQGFQGVPGVGENGKDGVTGAQGFQGRQGFQGFQGPKGSGKYFYGPTAPDSSDEGLTMGSKWFNTNVGAEFTYIVESDDTTQWVMVNVFSATGPQGPAGTGEGSGSQGFQGFQGPAGSGEGSGSQGFQGFQGNIGITGTQGFQGFQGPTGNGLFDTNYETGTEKSNSINYSTLGTVSGSARKIPVLLDDGSITFDYMRTSDLVPLFTVSTFRFDGNLSFKDYLIGSGTFDVGEKNVRFTFIPQDSTITDSVVNLVTSIGSSGFPFDMNGTINADFPTGSGISYPNSFVNGTSTVTLRLSVTSDDSNDTADFQIRFKQYNYYGVTASTSVSGEDLNLFTASLDNDYATSFTVDPQGGQYIYFAYPKRYEDNGVGSPEFFFGTNVVGFNPVHDSGGSTHTNASGYVEKYHIYRSTQPGLGAGTNITVS